MSWLFSQALVEDCLRHKCLDGKPSALLNWMNIADGYLYSDKMTDRCDIDSQFGMTFAHLTVDRGAAELMSSLEDFLAKTLAQQETNKELQEQKADCGNKCRALFAKYDQDLCLWKTQQCSLLEDWEQFSEIWPEWGSMQNGECWEQPKLAHHTKEIEFGLWPTPTATDATRGSPETMEAKQARGANTGWSLIDVLGYCPHPEFAEWLMGWPIGWTDLKPLETDKCHYVPQQLGNY
jgi:hypothetical protein